jgi:hypothetical protein
MFLISTLYYAMNAQIDLMSLQFCTEIEMECFYLVQNINSRKLEENYRKMQANKRRRNRPIQVTLFFCVDAIPEHVNFSLHLDLSFYKISLLFRWYFLAQQLYDKKYPWTIFLLQFRYFVNVIIYDLPVQHPRIFYIFLHVNNLSHHLCCKFEDSLL